MKDMQSYQRRRKKKKRKNGEVLINVIGASQFQCGGRLNWRVKFSREEELKPCV